MRSGLATATIGSNPRVMHVGVLEGRDCLTRSRPQTSSFTLPGTKSSASSARALSADRRSSSHAAAPGEIIGKTGGGHIVPVDDLDSLAAAIDSILAATPEWRRRARTAAVRVRQLFASDIVTRQLEALYRDLIGSSVGRIDARHELATHRRQLRAAVYNGRRWLREALDAIEAQRDGRPFEVIAVDDGSRDGSRRILEEAVRVGHLRLVDGPGRGIAAAINAGVEKRAIRSSVRSIRM